MSVTVTGGAGGITANLDDLAALARLMHAATTTIDSAIDTLDAPALRFSLTIGATREPLLADILDAELVALSAGHLADIRHCTTRLAALLLNGIDDYRRADRSVLSSITHALGDVGLGAAKLLDGNPAGATDVFSALPGLADLVMSVGGWLEHGYDMPDGHAVLHPGQTIVGPSPRDLTDLIDGLAVRNAGRDGEISVSLVTGSDGRQRAIVDIPGTKSWNPLPNHDVTSVGTDIDALDGRPTAYEQGIFAALHAAGVTPDQDVMLVGHSEGGIVAVNAARDAARSRRFRITHVLTAGSPVGVVSRALPDDVQLLALENTADLVPHLDSEKNPDRPNITTVSKNEQNGSITGNHDLTRSYRPIAMDAEHSCNASINAFTSSAREFLGTAPATMTTHVYRVTRGL